MSLQAGVRCFAHGCDGDSATVFTVYFVYHVGSPCDAACWLCTNGRYHLHWRREPGSARAHEGVAYITATDAYVKALELRLLGWAIPHRGLQLLRRQCDRVVTT